MSTYFVIKNTETDELLTSFSPLTWGDLIDAEWSLSEQFMQDAITNNGIENATTQELTEGGAHTEGDEPDEGGSHPTKPPIP